MNKLTQNAVFTKRLDWNLSTTELFEHFSALPWSVLLDSANAAHIDAKFDVICAEPVATIVNHGQSTTITRSTDRQPLFRFDQQPADNDLDNPKNEYAEKAAKHSVSSRDPFDLLNELLAEYYPTQKYSPFIFSGGVMGSFSYDIGRVIEKLPQIAANDISLPEMNLACYDWALIFDYKTQSWQLVHYQSQQALEALELRLNQLIEPSLLVKVNSTLESSLNVENSLNLENTQKLNTSKNSETDQQDNPIANSAFRLNGQWRNQLSEQAYKDKFEQVQAYLLSGDCYQINLTQRFSASYTGNEWQAYKALRESNGAPFSAFIRLEGHALLSISPERFIQHKNGDIQTKPIKGTMPRGVDPHSDSELAAQLKASEKDRAENVMIVDLLRNDIGKVALPGSVAVPHLFEVESFPAVHHLVSTVTAKLKPELNPTDLLRACFPGGSITGAPKIRAMSIIEELEPSRRSLYCGSIGYISQDGTMDTSITIRTLVAQRDETSHLAPLNGRQGIIHCWAGGGIVADSKVDAEYQESFDKISRILPVLSNLNR
ncbi:para-aminobenzoate synthase, subunit I [Shewanella halifaxensis HAW-EB4]|uniref:aminodeoxychorismate synthase n=1 Tax=Shewanella halifaxensis (strain HAW-EB4) TaxID=458817 RepID=B0TUT8_SHEHH|nr:aminodeoxychorismate synthase component I [Shewanella halifaxensis]ABZ76816.1 para-aminobenzoate synthase, subunit I [Shewanella halifaxensis HAW-EB4]